MAIPPSFHASPKLRSSLSFERRSKLLKDFLIDADNDAANSCSSNGGFRLLRSRSRAASNTISAIQKASEMVSNALKHLPFATSNIKPPSILPRSISRKLSGRRRDHASATKVKVKDILRWRSFRDLVEERSTPLDLPAYYSSSTSNSSSWCDSDFTAEDFPSWCYQTDACCFNESGMKMGKHYLLDEGVGKAYLKTTRTIHMDPKRHLPNDDEFEQHTPVSVLDSPFREDEESVLAFHRSLANVDMRKCMLMQRIKEFESLVDQEPINLDHGFSAEEYDGDEEEEDVSEAEEKARRLLGHLQDKILATTYDFHLENLLLFDFFKYELSTASGKQKNDQHERELVRLAENRLSGVHEGSFEWEVEGKRETYIREMERGVSWSMLEEQKVEMALQLEGLMMSSLVDELLVDLLAP